MSFRTLRHRSARRERAYHRSPSVRRESPRRRQHSPYRHRHRTLSPRHRRQLPRSKSSSDNDDEDRKGTIHYSKGELIDQRYEIVRVAGQGTFGTVFECIDHQRGGRLVAVKAVRSVERYLDAASIEIEILKEIRKSDPDNRSLCVRLLSWFSARHHHREHMFIVFENLGRDLYTFMKRNGHQGFLFADCRSFARQLLTAVQFCHNLKLTHTDLKPENILLCSSDYRVEDAACCGYDLSRPGREYRIPLSTHIRLIDFGGATYESDKHSKKIATRQYRAPEVILGLSWSFPSDIWSIGCILVELFTGKLLFSTHADLEHLALMEQVLDQSIPKVLTEKAIEKFRLSCGSQSNRSRPNRRRSSSPSECPTEDLISMVDGNLRWPENATGQTSIDHVRNYLRLEQMIPTHPEFVNLIRQMLIFDPANRITASQALGHPFFHVQQ